MMVKVVLMGGSSDSDVDDSGIESDAVTHVNRSSSNVEKIVMVRVNVGERKKSV